MTDSPSKPAPAPVWRVARDVGKLALQLADGDRARLQVTGPDAVVVHNRPRR